MEAVYSQIIIHTIGLFLINDPKYTDGYMSRLTFDLDVLRTFVTGLDLGSFAKAAERLGRSTSAVSAQLKKLESQVGVPVLCKSGRGLEPTPAGEMVLAYARRLLDINDEAAAAVRGVTLQGSVRLGLQEDFAEHMLTAVLGGFTRAHPRVHVEARVARNAQLLDLISSGRLDLALAWDSGTVMPHSQFVATLPMRWIGAPETSYSNIDEQVSLVSLEPPCLMRAAAIDALERAKISWRPAFTSQSLGGVWAAVEAGLGVTVRTSAGLPRHLRILGNLPELPSINLILYWAEADPPPVVSHLGAILLEALSDVMDGDVLRDIPFTPVPEIRQA